MGGVSLTRDGTLTRYNPAYRAVLARPGSGGAPKLTIPMPIGLIRFFGEHSVWHLSDDPLFNPDSAGFNPLKLIDLILNPPFYYPLKETPEFTNDVELGVGKDSLQILLGNAQALVPSGPFGFTTVARPFDLTLSAKGVRFGVISWIHYDVEFEMGDSLLAVLKQGHPVAHQTTYDLSQTSLGQGGLAPTLGWAGKVYGNNERGFYVGGAVHYYLGAAYGEATSTGGFTTSDTIFGSNPLTPSVVNQVTYSGWGKALGRGVGVDVGAVWVSGPLEFGLGVNDIGSTIKWRDARTKYQQFDTTSDDIVTDSVRYHEAKTKLPVTYLGNVSYTTGPTTLGLNLVNSGRETTVRVGVEQRFGPFVLRGGLGRDQRKRAQFAGGGGIRFGPFSLDAGIWTHSNSLSDERGVMLATSFSIY